MLKVRITNAGFFAQHPQRRILRIAVFVRVNAAAGQCQNVFERRLFALEKSDLQAIINQREEHNVNGGVAKTLIRHLIRWVAEREMKDAATAPVLRAVLDTEISPELVPATDGKIQSTEATVGPYALNDFFLFHITRYGSAPSKAAYLAHQAWGDAAKGAWPEGTPHDERVAYDLKTIKAWLRRFLIRFFQTSQFKRSAVPNGPKVVTGGSLSPRGDWRAPSDSSARVWLDELDNNVPDA